MEQDDTAAIEPNVSGVKYKRNTEDDNVLPSTTSICDLPTAKTSRVGDNVGSRDVLPPAVPFIAAANNFDVLPTAPVKVDRNAILRGNLDKILNSEAVSKPDDKIVITELMNTLKQFDSEKNDNQKLNKDEFRSLYIFLSYVVRKINFVNFDIEWVRNFGSEQGASAMSDGLKINRVIFILSWYLSCLNFVRCFSITDKYCNSVNNMMLKADFQDILDNTYVSLELLKGKVLKSINDKIAQLDSLSILNEDAFEYKVNLDTVSGLITNATKHVSLRNFYEILFCLCDDKFKGLTPDNLYKKEPSDRDAVEKERIKLVADLKNKGYLDLAVEIHTLFMTILTEFKILDKFKVIDQLENKVRSHPTDKEVPLPEINGEIPRTIARCNQLLIEEKNKLFKLVFDELYKKNHFICRDDYKETFKIYLKDTTFFGTIARSKKQSPQEAKMMILFSNLFYENNLCDPLQSVAPPASTSSAIQSRSVSFSPALRSGQTIERLSNAVSIFDQLNNKNNVCQDELLGYEERIYLWLFNAAQDNYDVYINGINDAIKSDNKPLRQQIMDAGIIDMSQKHICNKMLFDLLDLAHDINYRHDFLINILSFLCKDESAKIVNMFAVSGSARQSEIRAERKNIVDLIKDDLIRAGVCFPDLTDIILTRQESNVRFFKLCIDNESDKSWLYKESGRMLEVGRLFAYYNSLDDENKNNFKTSCRLISGVDSMKFENYFRKTQQDILKMDEDKNVKLYAITDFDGCGTKVDTIASGMSFSVFDNVFGVFRYSVFSNKINQKDIGHLVVVTENVNGTILATFCFEGKVTLNSLIDEANKTLKLSIKTRGCGSDPCKSVIYNLSISGFIQKYNLQDVPQSNGVLAGALAEEAKLKPQTGILFITTNIERFISLFDNSIGKTASSNQDFINQCKQMLLFLNKTIGDLIFSAYAGIKVITTTDALVTHSVWYNFFKGNSICLQEVWRKGSNGSTTVSPGVFIQDTVIMSKIILNNMVVYRYIVHYLTSYSSDFTPVNNDILQRCGTKLEQVPFDIEEFPFYRVNQAVEQTFKFVPQAKHVDLAGGPDSLYKQIMLQFILAENEYIQSRLFDNLNKIAVSSNDVDFYKLMYSLPNLTTAFRSNSFNDAEINEADVNFDEFNEIFNLLTEIKCINDEVIFTFYAPGIPSFDKLFANIKNIKKNGGAVPEEFFTRTQLGDNTAEYRDAHDLVLRNHVDISGRTKLFKYTIIMYGTVDFFMQIRAKLIDYYRTNNFIGMEKKICEINIKKMEEKILLFFKPLYKRLALINNQWDTSRLIELLTQTGVDINEDIDENEENNECFIDNGSSRVTSVCVSGSACAMDRSGGRKKPNRGSTRGKKLKHKKFTKRLPPRRSSLKKRTIKHYRKKHNTRRR